VHPFQIDVLKSLGQRRLLGLNFSAAAITVQVAKAPYNLLSMDESLSVAEAAALLKLSKAC
jgi:hypothetical protein